MIVFTDRRFYVKRRGLGGKETVFTDLTEAPREREENYKL